MILQLTFFTFVLAIVVSNLEIQIEGKNGWAKNLPTWKNDSNFYTRLSGKTLTGYHIWLLTLVVFVYHNIFFLLDWSLSREILIVGFISVFFVVADFLWFMFNPNFGLKRFNSKHIPWHKKWLWIFPTEYYWGIALFIVSIVLGSSNNF